MEPVCALAGAARTATQLNISNRLLIPISSPFPISGESLPGAPAVHTIALDGV
jgi:hypothetical protein